MDPLSLLVKELRIHRKCCRSLSERRFVCLVQESWVKYLRASRFTTIDKSWYASLSEGESQMLLARSYEKVPKPWSRLSIKVISKQDRKNIMSLIDEPLTYSERSLSTTEVLGYTAQDRFQRVCEIGEEKYKRAATPNREVKPPQAKPYNNVVREALLKIHSCPVFSLSTGQPTVLSSPSSAKNKFTHANISPAICIIESQRAFYVVQSYVPYTLWDAVVFSPALIESSYSKPLFILYQILKAIKHCHSKGISVGELRLTDIFMDSKLWITLCQPNICRTFKSIEPPPQKHPQKPKPKCTDYKHDDLPSLVQKWTYGEISNFDYLMALNHLAGRRMGDPNHHPILPWVVDFKSENGGYRDLTMSKYRLNKGDAQLDLTYDASSPFMAHTDRHGDPLQIPHHVSDMLSDITYLVYRARRVPKSVLCQHVRSKWVPAEYPSTMERMQQWTPDECIPEFFTDPEIFSSIHEDLGDLEVPHWCSGADEFVRKHMAILEGEHVSQRLHHWIDLTFGYKLSGSAAVKAKNVCLQLVDKHTHLLNHGVVPLFRSPHPARSTRTSSMPTQLAIRRPKLSPQQQQQQQMEVAAQRDVNSRGGVRASRGVAQAGKIILPAGYEPLELLDQLEALNDFSLQANKQLPPEHKQEVLEPESPGRSQLSRDLQAIVCLVMDLVLSPRMRTVASDAPFPARYQQAYSIATTHSNEIARPLRQLVELLLQPCPESQLMDNDPEAALYLYPRLDPSTGLPMPTVDALLQAGGGPVAFPGYMPGLYDVLYRLKEADAAISSTFSSTDTNLHGRHLRMRRLAKEKVMVFGRYLKRHAWQLGSEGLELLMPYVTELFEDAATTVQAAWYLFNPMAQALGTQKTSKFFLPLLTSIFDDESTTPKHMKLYHRTYIIQLIVRLGLECFLSSFSTLLVEASAGYKNFTNDDLDRQISNDTDLMEDQTNRVSDVFMEGGSEAVFTSSDEHDKQDERDTSNGDDVFQDVEEAQEAQDEEEQESSDSSSLHNDSNSLDTIEDITGKSVGRISVHSVSRLLEDSKLQQRMSEELSSESATTDCDTVKNDDDDDDNNEDRQQRDRSPSPDNVSMSEISVGARGRGSNHGATTSASQEEDFTRSIMDQPGGVEYNISDVAGETIKWLAHRLGPVLTAKYLSRNLLRMLGLCYLGQEQLEIIAREVPPTSHGPLSTTEKHIEGDLHAAQVLDCLACIAILYGEQFILLQYFTHLKDLVNSAQKKLNLRGEASLVGCVMLLIHIIPYISDSTLMDILQETIVGELLLPLIKVVSCVHLSFPSGAPARRVLCYKLIDLLYILSLRIGFENTRQHMTFVLQKFFVAFNKVYADPTLAAVEAGGVLSGEEGGTEGQRALANGAQGLGAEPGVPSGDGSTSGLLFEIKMDSRTQEYKVDMPFRGPTGELRTHHRTGSGGSLKQYSLSPPATSPTAAASTAAREKESGSKEGHGEEGQAHDVQQELKDTFTPELAHLAYIPFCRLAGGIHMEQNLINDDLIRQLCSFHDQEIEKNKANSALNNHAPIMMNDHSMDSKESEACDDGVSGSFGTQVAGNKIMVTSPPAKRRSQGESAAIDFDRIRSPEMDMNKHRHLRGNWLAYWEHEVGRSDNDDTFNCKQIKLQTFQGHTNSVRALYVLDNENSFISASKDKTIKLWSLRSSGDGSGRVGCQWSYPHKKSVFAVTFIESMRLAASCDSSVHVWDPFTGECVRRVENNKAQTVSMLTAMPPPHTSLITGTSDATIRFLDVRTGSYMYELKSCTSPAGSIRCGAVSPDGHWIALGFATGMVTVLDARTGMMAASFKAHEGEVLQIKACNNKQFVTSSIDQTMTLWNDDGKAVCHLKGPTESVHCFSFYSKKVISGTTANKIGVHSSLDAQARYSNTKLKSDVFRGVLTTMAVLPLNRLLLLGSDSGTIKLLA